MSEFDLHPDRLGTTDASGRRIFPQPADVQGRFRKRRDLTEAILILIFLALPWIRIAGRQALLLDIPNRQFEIFGLSLRAHNAPLLVLVFAAAFFGLFFVTSIWGRIWCGWACPQTVFIDGVFRRIERAIEGSALERRKLDRAPFSLRKFRLRATKWTAYAIVCAVISHSFMAYFVGTDQMATMMTHSPLENWSAFVFMAVLTAILIFNFGWFREQFCVIVCPYGRFQSVLMDANSQIIAYDVARGEPRATPQSKVHSKTHGTALGDCVNCYRCVQVCPVGIDIRRGVQMECIACTGCIDACDDVMTKIKKPTGLIRYDTLAGLKKRARPRWTLRSVIYAKATLVSLTALFILLYLLKPIEVTFVRAADVPYQLISDPKGDTVVNHFNVELSNQSGSSHRLDFNPVVDAVEIISAPRPFAIEKNSIIRNGLFIRFPRTILKDGRGVVRVRIVDTDELSGREHDFEQEVPIVGPLG